MLLGFPHCIHENARLGFKIICFFIGLILRFLLTVFELQELYSVRWDGKMNMNDK